MRTPDPSPFQAVILFIRHRFWLLLLLFLAGIPAWSQIGFTEIHSLGVSNSVGVIPGQLVRGADGLFYGATAAGAGTLVGGTIFRLDSDGANPLAVVKFSDIADGVTTQHRLVYGSDGAIYAFYHTLGSSTDGGLVKVETNGSGFQILTTAQALQTRTWIQLMEGSDGRLYAFAGNKIVRINGDGTGFESIYADAAYVFGDSSSSPSDQLLEGADKVLYVSQFTGGTSGRGLIFKINKDGTGRTNLLDFPTIGPELLNSPHQLIQGSDGILYGVAVGSTDQGSPIFRLNTDGTAFRVIARLKTFPVQGPNGTLFEGGLASSLLEGADGFLYGATQNGGTNRAGLVFRLARDGSGFTNLMEFPPSYFLFDSEFGVNRTPGKYLGEGLDGRMHGSLSGRSVFRFRLDGSNFETTYNFPDPGIEGKNITASLASDTNGVLYGSSRSGGPGDHGTVFRLKTDGAEFSYLHGFANVQDGSEPVGGVIVGSDGNLYGVCYSGGSGTVGTVFRMGKDGSDYRVLRAFVMTGGDGRFPAAPLIEASDRALYGSTYFGGGAAVGSIYKLNKDGSGYSIIFRFTNAISGANPSARLLEGADGRLYGSAETNGPSGQGVIFALEKSGGGFTLLHNFSSTLPSLRKPQGGLIQGVDGLLYGTTSAGGTDGFGGVFKLKPDGSAFQVIHPFSASGGDGRAPVAGVTFGPDGMLYGVTQFGGGSINGSIFRLNTDGTGYEKLRAFSGTNNDGGNPSGEMVPASDGLLYGTTAAGGSFNFGTIFRVSFSTPAPSLSIAAKQTGQFEIAWPDSAVAYQLQTNSDLSNPAGWQAVPDLPVASDGHFRVPITASNDAIFYRLIKP